MKEIKSLIRLFKESLSDVDLQGSSKRFITYAVFAVLTTMIALVAFKVTNYDAIQAMWKDMIMIFMVLIGAITSEKFTKRGISPGQDKVQNDLDRMMDQAKQ